MTFPRRDQHQADAAAGGGGFGLCGGGGFGGGGGGGGSSSIRGSGEGNRLLGGREGPILDGVSSSNISRPSFFPAATPSFFKSSASVEQSFVGGDGSSSCWSSSSAKMGCWGGGGGGGGTIPSSPGRNKRKVDDIEEDVIAQAMNKLSMKDREDALQDVHCIVDDDDAKLIHSIENDPTRVNAYRQQLNKELKLKVQQHKLKQLHSSRGSPTTTVSKLCAYEQALQRDSSYVSNYDFQTLFLRDTKYNVKEAATKLYDFMEEKLQLWGIDKLCQDITLEDFDDGDLRYMKDGFFQHLPLQDRIGRDILVVYLHFPEYCTARNVCRSIYYVIMSINKRQQQLQQKNKESSSTSLTKSIGGIVELIYNMKFIDHQKDARQIFQETIRFRHLLPGRMAAIHILTEDPFIKYFVKTVHHLLSTFQLSRVKIHTGPPMEIRYELLSHGIPINVLPFQWTGEWCTQNHQYWLQQQRDMEQLEVQRRREVNLILPEDTGTATGMTNNKNNDKMIITMDDDDEEAVGVVAPAGGYGDGATTSSKNANPKNGAATIVQYPEPSDILLGRGSHIDRHPGNVQFQQLVLANVPQYEIAPKWMKTLIVEQMVTHIQSQTNIRILKQLPSIRNTHGDELILWEHVQDISVLRGKVSRTIRQIRATTTTTSSSSSDNGNNDNALDDDVLKPTTDYTPAGTTSHSLPRTDVASFNTMASLQQHQQQQPQELQEQLQLSSRIDPLFKVGPHYNLDIGIDRTNTAIGSIDHEDDDGDKKPKALVLVVDEPNDTDILLGRGKIIDNHPGNIQFRKVLQTHYDNYEQAPKWVKTQIAQQILNQIQHQPNVRFLKQQDTTSQGGSGGGGNAKKNSTAAKDGSTSSTTVWEEVTDSAMLREKISRTLRRIRASTK